MKAPKISPAELAKMVNEAIGPDSVLLGSHERFQTAVLPTGVFDQRRYLLTHLLSQARTRADGGSGGFGTHPQSDGPN